jgi:SAM-dependent methyltransferase
VTEPASFATLHGGAEDPFSSGASVHRPPRARLVDRIEFITNYVTARSVIDLGFVDESRMVSKQAIGTWLHATVARKAVSAVGIDSDPVGVELARELGYEAHAADCEDREALAGLGLEPADVVVAGELIEHLDQPGRFLEAVKVLVKPTGTLLITTPNALSMTNFLGSLMQRELVNPDHVSWFSWHTLKTLLGRHGWTIRDVAYYGFPQVPMPEAAQRADRMRVRTFNSYQRFSRPLFRLRPTLSDGIIVVAGRVPEAT